MKDQDKKPMGEGVANIFEPKKKLDLQKMHRLVSSFNRTNLHIKIENVW
jgi:hypothetical protein